MIRLRWKLHNLAVRAGLRHYRERDVWTHRFKGLRLRWAFASVAAWLLGV